jgi:molybdenum cofactor cytidylyltransferase
VSHHDLVSHGMAADRELASTALVVLAAGSGTRFDARTSKLLVDVGGRPLVSWALSAAAMVPAGGHFVVTQDSRLDGLVPEGFIELRNQHPGDGLASSLALAVDATLERRLGALTVGLGDQPLIGAKAWYTVASATVTGVAIATYTGKRGNPVKIASSVFGLLARQGDVGARGIFDRVNVVEVPCQGNPMDVDTWADLARVRATERKCYGDC